MEVAAVETPGGDGMVVWACAHCGDKVGKIDRGRAIFFWNAGECKGHLPAVVRCPNRQCRKLNHA